MTFAGLVIYLIFLYIRPQDWVPFFLGLPVDYIIFILLILIMLLTDELKLELNSFNIVFMFWIFAVMLSTIANGHIDQTVQWGIEYLKRFIVYIAFLSAISTPEKFKKIIMVMIILSAILGLQNIYQVKNGIGWAGQALGWLDQAAIEAGEKGRAKWVGLWDGMNVLCLLFVIMIPFILQFLSNTRSLFFRLFLFANLLLILVGAFLTKSRGGFIAFLVVLFLHYKDKFKGVFGKVVIILGIVGLLALAPSRFTTVNDDSNSAAGRIDMWVQGFEMLRYYPLFGIGMGNYANYTGSLIAHNSFIQIMGETGVIGLFAWVSLLYLTFKGLNKARKETEDEQLLMYLTAIYYALIGYLFTSVFITTEFVLLYLLIGIAASLTNIAGVKIEFELPDAVKVTGIIIGLMLTFFIGIRIFWAIA